MAVLLGFNLMRLTLLIEFSLLLFDYVNVANELPSQLQFDLHLPSKRRRAGEEEDTSGCGRGGDSCRAVSWAHTSSSP